VIPAFAATLCQRTPVLAQMATAYLVAVTHAFTDLGVSGRGGSAFFSAGCSLSSDHVTATTSAAGLVIKSLTVIILGDTTIAESKCTLAAAYALTAPCTCRAANRITQA
jgi:hypothetical protein